MRHLSPTCILFYRLYFEAVGWERAGAADVTLVGAEKWSKFVSKLARWQLAKTAEIDTEIDA
jgi:hypothetical protein